MTVSTENVALPGTPEPPPAAGASPEAPPPAALPEPPPSSDTKPKRNRPTTRAGRRAEAEARKAAKARDKETTPKAPATKPAPRRAPLEARLSGSIATLGTAVVVAGAASSSTAVQADGMLIVEHGPNVAHALAELAKDNPAVAAALERMLTAGAWAGVITAVTPIVIGIAANHGAIPAGLAGMLAAGPDQAPAPDAG